MIYLEPSNGAVAEKEEEQHMMDFNEWWEANKTFLMGEDERTIAFAAWHDCLDAQAIARYEEQQD